MKDRTYQLVVLILTLGGIASATGYEAQYGPFAPADKPRLFPVRECIQKKTDAPSTFLFVSPAHQQSAAGVRLTATKPERFEAEVIDTKATRLAGPWQLPEIPSHSPGITVFYADLNRDGKLDFIIQAWLGGCGLASGYCQQTFLLSSQQGYKATTMTNLYPSREDFVDLQKNGSCQVIRTMFAFGSSIPNGPSHNYWVYSLHSISGDSMISGNNLLPKFPRWVWYSFKPNHRPADNLTETQQEQMWKALQTEDPVTVLKTRPEASATTPAK